MDTREKLIEQKVKIGEESICHKCIHNGICIGEANQPCIECNRFIDSNGVTVQQWIPVTERLPEDCGSYIVVVKYKYDHEKEYDYGVDVATYYTYDNPDAYIDNHWDTYNDWYEGQQYIHITHWMQLPEKPKEE